MLKKFFGSFIVFLLLFSFTLNFTEASSIIGSKADGIVKNELIEEEEYTTHSKQLIERTRVEFGGIVSGARYSNTTNTGIRIYNKKGGLSLARADLNKVGVGEVIARVNSSGNITYTKTSSAGTVSVYRSSSGDLPTLTYTGSPKQKIRYD